MSSLRLLPAREVRLGEASMRWELVSVALLRTTGVAASLLEGFLAPELDRAWASLRDAEHTAGRLQTELRRTLYGPVFEALLDAEEKGSPAFVSLRRAQRRVARGRAVPADDRTGWAPLAGALADEWNAALHAVSSAAAALEDVYEQAADDRYRHLKEVLEDPRLQEAAYISNPDFARRFFRPGGTHEQDRAPNAAGRRDLLTAHRFLRRLCTRCETASFFGPVLHTTLDESAGAELTLGPPRPERVAVDGSVWLVRRLAQQAARAVPPLERRVRRDPLWRREGGGLVNTFDGQRRAVSGAALRLWAELEEESTLGEALGRAGVAEGAAGQVARELAGVVRPAYEPPSTTLHGLAALVERVDPRGRALPERFLDLAGTFAGKPWPARREAFETAEALTAEHRLDADAPSGHFSDRSVFHEERSSPQDQQVVIGGAAVDELAARLGPLLVLCLLGALLAREDAREAVRRHLGGSAAPLAAVAAADLEQVDRRHRRLTGRLADLVRAQSGTASSVEIDGRRLLDAVEDLWAQAGPERTVACLPSLDLLWDGPALGTAGAWVLGELHDDCSSIYGGCTTRLHDEPDRLFADFCALVEGAIRSERMATVVSRRRSKHITPELPGISVELTGRSRKPHTQRVEIAEVVVPPSADGVLVRGTHRQLYPGDLRSVVHRALSLPAVVPVPVQAGQRTPRIVVDGIVYQRATWILDLPGDPGGHRGWLALQRLREEHELPRAVFIRHPAEPKPMYVDFGDPLALRDLARLTPAAVRVTEALPDRRDAWWPDPGGRQVAELRLGCLLRLVRP